METPKNTGSGGDASEDEDFEAREYSSPPCYLHEFEPPAEAAKKKVREGDAVSVRTNADEGDENPERDR